MQSKSSPYKFYGKILEIILKKKVPFVVGGGFAVFEYTGYNRPTNDLDIFCRAGDFPKIVAILKDAGINISVLDERWLAKATCGIYYVDLLYSSPNYLVTVDDIWFEKSRKTILFGSKVRLAPPEELIWCKAYIQDRYRYDGADINHLILFSGSKMDWKRLLSRMENNWELLLALVLNFRFVYPSERHLIPGWLLKELISRLAYQIENPAPVDKICRGPLLSRTQYKTDVSKLGFETI